MKRIIPLTLAALLLTVTYASAFARPTSYTEIFAYDSSVETALFDDGLIKAARVNSKTGAVKAPGTGALFNFDLTGLGGSAQLFEGTIFDHTVLNTIAAPSTDATGFDATLDTVYGATLSFTIHDTDKAVERVLYGVSNGGGPFSLQSTGELDLRRKTPTVDLLYDFDLSGTLSYLGNGMLMAFAVAPTISEAKNDWYIEEVALTVSAVPEPSTLLLLGSGLFGLAWYSRKRKQA